MVKLGREILRLLVEESGSREVLRRLSDPFWFQALGCVLGFDWHSSGVTTTVCGAVSEVVTGHEGDFGFLAAGGKGNRSRKTPNQLAAIGERLGIDADRLTRVSKLTAKVDSSAVQDGYQVYQHMIFSTFDGAWCVVQQGMNDSNGMARRYHWLHETGAADFVRDPHAAVCCDDMGLDVLNLVAGEAEPVREHSVDLSRLHPDIFLKDLNGILRHELPRRHAIFLRDLNWDRLRSIQTTTYEAPPADYAGLLAVPGMGPKGLRALALVSELLHGDALSWRDPARFSFAHGGKDGIPHPVDRETYDHTIDILRELTGRSKIEVSEKEGAFRRLATFATDRRVPPPRKQLMSPNQLELF